MKQYEALSFCGIYCGGCKNYKENMNCMGCRHEKELVNDCSTRSCCINKGLLHCGECASFPCDGLEKFYNGGIPHRAVAYENILKIKEVGIKKFLSDQNEEHTCECGRKKLWFTTKCVHSINDK